MEKQIEEMLRIVKETCDAYKWCSDCPFESVATDGYHEYDTCVARVLYNAGYRKVSEGEWKRNKENCLYNKCSVCEYEHCRENNFCPNCGAKMKGGE